MSYRSALIALLSAASSLQGVEPEPIADYWRVREHQSGARVELEMVQRTFAPVEGDGPSVTLTAAVHIGEPSFYTALQERLDAMDLVLFEGVKPALDWTDAGPQTQEQLKLIGELVDGFHAISGSYPEDLETLGAQLPARDARVLDVLRIDRWSQPVMYDVTPDGGGYTLSSVGPDGQAGTADDVTPDRIGFPEASEDEGGLQRDLAEGLGLVFQLDAMRHDKPHWRNSDMTIDELRDRLEVAGAGQDVLLALEGDSFSAKLVGFVMKIMRMSPMLSGMGRLTLIELLGRADEVFELVPGMMGPQMDVILGDRNEIVIADLREAIESRSDGEIGVLYGAAHLEEIEGALREMGYEVSGETWEGAIGVSARDLGMRTQEFRQMRSMMNQMIRSQLRSMQRYMAR